MSNKLYIANIDAISNRNYEIKFTVSQIAYAETKEDAERKIRDWFYKKYSLSSIDDFEIDECL